MKSILVTGAAGFIGMHVCETLLLRGEHVVGVDNLNDYYPITLKKARLARLMLNPAFSFECLDMIDMVTLSRSVARHQIDRVVHLAAQAGVRFSITNPHEYGSNNLVGFLNILELCRQLSVKHFVYASSSSVYGGNRKMPFSEADAVDHPVSLYAATKRANELMAHSYSHLYDLPSSGLRFFTVYGPWGRPDMSPILFARAIFEGRPIDVFNYGIMKRDFTYIKDIAEGVVRVLDRPAKACPEYDKFNPNSSTSDVPWRIFNIGNHQPVGLLDYIGAMEKAIGRAAIIHLKPMQAGDVLTTYADTRALNEWVGFSPSTSLDLGLVCLIKWVRDYYGY